MNRLAGKRAIVTGAAQGQGAAIARAFVEEGARVVIADVADEPGQLLADELASEHGDAAYFRHHDVSDEASWQALVEEANEQLRAGQRAGQQRRHPALRRGREDGRSRSSSCSSASTSSAASSG